MINTMSYDEYKEKIEDVIYKYGDLINGFDFVLETMLEAEKGLKISFCKKDELGIEGFECSTSSCSNCIMNIETIEGYLKKVIFNMKDKQTFNDKARKMVSDFFVGGVSSKMSKLKTEEETEKAIKAGKITEDARKEFMTNFYFPIMRANRETVSCLMGCLIYHTQWEEFIDLLTKKLRKQKT